MRVIHKSLRREIGKRGVCEYCGRKAKTDCAHIWGKGAGWIDIAENFVALDRWCHSTQHNSNTGNKAEPSRKTLMEIVCKREGVPKDEWPVRCAAIKERVDRLRAMKAVKVWDVDKMGPAPE